jgi:hypothetical protein
MSIAIREAASSDEEHVLWLRNPFTGMQEEGFVVAEEDFMVARSGTSPHRSAVSSGGTPRSGSRLKGTRTRASLSEHTRTWLSW